MIGLIEKYSASGSPVIFDTNCLFLDDFPKALGKFFASKGRNEETIKLAEKRIEANSMRLDQICKLAEKRLIIVPPTVYREFQTYFRMVSSEGKKPKLESLLLPYVSKMSLFLERFNGQDPEIIRPLASYFQVKERVRDTFMSLPKKGGKERSPNSADVEISSMAYFLSQMSESGINVVSRDGDIYNILSNAWPEAEFYQASETSCVHHFFNSIDSAAVTLINPNPGRNKKAKIGKLDETALSGRF